jgi:small subunit ribosomal protein S8
MPVSKLKGSIAEILRQGGLHRLLDHAEDAQVGKTLVIELKYGPSRERSIAGLRRVSKPGLRCTRRSTELPKVLGGLGIAIISTSTGC